MLCDKMGYEDKFQPKENFIKFQENFPTYKAKMKKLINDFQHPIETLILKHPSDVQELIHFLRGFIKSFDKDIVELYKYTTIFYHCAGSSLCYIHSGKGQIYIGFVRGHKMKKRKELEADGRKLIRVLKFSPSDDVNVKLLKEILKEAVCLNKGSKKK